MRSLLTSLVVLASALLVGGVWLRSTSAAEAYFPPLLAHVPADSVSTKTGEGLAALLSDVVAPAESLSEAATLQCGGGTQEHADDLLRGIHTMEGFPQVELPSDLTWTEDPFDDPTWAFRQHSLCDVASLTAAFERTNDVRYLQRAEDMTLDWIADNSPGFLKSAPSRFSWSDHTTALRLLQLLVFYETWGRSDLATAEELATVFRSMAGHAQLLASSELYQVGRNHGIDQDLALAGFARAHPYATEARDWLDLAASRLQKQFEHAISSAGIHLEHSATYHLYGMGQLRAAIGLLGEAAADEFDLHRWESTLELMAEYVPDIVRPDGTLVQYGDTQYSTLADYSEWLDLELGLAELLSGSRPTRGEVDRNEARVYPDEGYVVIRGGLGEGADPANRLHLFFTAGAHPERVHRQADDLSFSLFALGREIITDPGVYSYRDDAGRRYAIGAMGHNAVVVDGHSYDGFDTSLDHHVLGNGYTLVQASHRNYENLEQTRWLLHVEPDLVVIVDRLRALDPAVAGEWRFEQMLHIAPELDTDLHPSGPGVDIRAGDDLVATVMQYGTATPSVEIIEGQAEPMQGWHSREHGVLAPAPALVSRLDGAGAVFVTSIQLAEPGVATTTDVGAEQEGDLVRVWHSRPDAHFAGELDVSTGDFSVES